jgi:3-dehydroquinate synthetase
VLDHLAADKKHASGHLRWVLPTESGVAIHADVPLETVRLAAGELLAAGSPA